MSAPLYIFGLVDVLGRHDGELLVPNAPVIRTALGLTVAKAEVWIWSGLRRSQDLSEWVHRNVPTFSKLRMRGPGTRLPTDELKLEWLRLMEPADRSRLVAVFDSAQRSVDMWAAQGVSVFQVRT